jgi:phosphoglycolate phosphatase
MQLKELAKYRHIVIQCHDIPDADTIGAGFALQCFLRFCGTVPNLVYGGAADIQKPSLLMMLEVLDIQISHVRKLPPETDLLITVDCQRGSGNVEHFDLPATARVVVIDHHYPEIPEDSNTIIRPYLASCATLVWDLLQKEGKEGYKIEFKMDWRVQNALYYGLFTDSNGLSELRHPLDRDLAELPIDIGLIRKLKNSAITAEELDIISRTLCEREMVGNIGLFRSEPCDSNLLGFIGDIAQQVVNMDCCVIYCRQQQGLKLSIRSSAREIMANEIAEFLCRSVGSGGGNIEKAGGFMNLKGIAAVSEAVQPEEYLKNRVFAYLDNYDLIYAGDNAIRFDEMPLYKKLPNPVKYAKSIDIFPGGTKISVRTLEGDIDTIVSKEIYLMIGIKGEVYPILREKFDAGYIVSDVPYKEKLEYTPAILSRVTGERKEVLFFANTCMPKNSKLVRAKELEKDTKIFTYWDSEKYFYGTHGDWLVADEGAFNDCYIVRRDIFADSYEPI